MSRPKPPGIVRYTIRLKRAQAERVAAIKAQLHAKSDNEVFDYLVTVAADQRDDLVQLVYGLFGNLADNLTHRFQSLETVSQLHLALTDSYIKYALTALPEVPQSFLAGARARAALIYEQVTSLRRGSFNGAGIPVPTPRAHWVWKTALQNPQAACTKDNDRCPGILKSNGLAAASENEVANFAQAASGSPALRPRALPG